MNLTLRFKRAKVARRMFALFMFGALVPIGALALFAFSQLVNRLNDMRTHDLDVASELVMREIRDRIEHIATELTTIIVAPPSGDVGTLRARVAASEYADVLVGAAVVFPDGSTADLANPIEVPFPVDSLRGPPSAGPVPRGVMLLTGPGTPRTFWLAAPASATDRAAGVVLLQLAPAYLFDDAVAVAGEQTDRVCVVDREWAPIRCPAPLGPSALAVLADSGGGERSLRWEGAEGTVLGGYTASTFRSGLISPPWGVVTTAPRIGLLDAVGDFGRTFIIITVLIVVGVFVFSHLQIGRSLRPLKQLQDATAKVADRRFGEPVVVTSGDEFEELARSFNAMAHQVESQFKALTAMNEIGRSVLSTAKINEIVETVLDRAPNIAACDAVVFCLRAAPTSSAAGQTASGGWNIHGRPAGGTQTLTATVAPTRSEVEELWNCATQVTVDLDQSPRTYVDLVELVKRGIIYFVVFPIHLKNEVAGAIAIGFTEPPDVQGDNILRAKRLVDQVTVALRNAELITELGELNLGTISALARTIDASSPWTAGHSTRVTKMALDIAKELRLPRNKVDILHRGGLLHDIGKIGTPPTILNKPGRLDPDELKIMQDHTVVGAKILAPIPQYAEIIPIVRHHHERLDGKGYPDRIAGDEIPFLARVLAVADIFDALISDRPYRAGWPEERVVGEIQNMAGTHLDPQVVEAFLTVKAPTLSRTRKSIPYLSVEMDDFYTWID